MPDIADFLDFITRLPNLAIIALAGDRPGPEAYAI